MTDRLPFDLPFTADELVRAQQFVHPPEVASAMVRETIALAADDTGITLMDGTLLLLAALSDEVAERVVAHCPRLRKQVEQIRADPQAFVSSLRPRTG